jgi:hypothetical protein
MTKRGTSVATIIVLATLGVALGAGAPTREPTTAVTTSEAPTARPLARLEPIATYFTFTLDSFKITHTRSLYNDTDFVQIGVKVGSNAPITAPTKAMGDVNRGTHPVNLSISNVLVPAGETVYFSYSIVNTGYDANSVEQALKSAMTAALSKALTAAAATGGTVVACIACGAVVGPPASNWFTNHVESILFPNCDGTVAAGDHAFPQSTLAQATANGNIVFQVDDNKGTDSPIWCGANSRYHVTWSASAGSPYAATTGCTGGGRSGGTTHQGN